MGELEEWSVQIRLLLWATLNPGLSHSFEESRRAATLIVTPERETRYGHHFVASYEHWGNFIFIGGCGLLSDLRE